MKMMIMRRMQRIPSDRNYRHIAFAIKGGAIVATGLNLTRHAEIAALLALYPNERKDVKIVSIRVRRDGSFAMAKPCKSCESFMRHWGVKKVVWTDSNGVFHTERYR